MQRTLDALERERAGGVRWFNPFVVVGIPAGVAGLVTYLANVPFLPWALFAVAAWLLARWAVALRNVADSFKRRVLPLLVAEIDRSLRYDPKGIAVGEFMSSGLFQKPDQFESQDAVYGAIGGTPVRFAMVRAGRLTKTGSHTHVREPIFDGLLFVAEFNKRIKGTTQVLPGGTSALDALTNTDVALEDPRFNEEFHVRSTDQVEARYILTPTMIELILKLREQFSGVHLQFSGNSVLIALPTNYGLLTPDLEARFDMAQVTRILGRLAAIAGIVKYLGLDTRIWSKSATPPAAPSAKPVLTPVDAPISRAAPSAEFSDPHATLFWLLFVTTQAVALGIGALTMYRAYGSVRASLHGEVGMGGMAILVGIGLYGFLAAALFCVLAAWPMYRAKNRKDGGLTLLAGANVLGIVWILVGMALPIDRGSEPQAAVTLTEKVAAEEPAAISYASPAPKARAAKEAPPAHALTEEDLAKIPTPRATHASQWGIEAIKRAARAGNVSRVEAVSPDGAGDEIGRFKQSVLDAMAAKLAHEAAKQAESIAASPSSRALSDAELEKIPAPRIQAPQSRAQIEGIKEAAKIGNASHIKAVLPEDIDNVQVDLFKQAVLRAMAAKAAQVYEEQLRQLQQQPSGNAPPEPR